MIKVRDLAFGKAKKELTLSKTKYPLYITNIYWKLFPVLWSPISFSSSSQLQCQTAIFHVCHFIYSRTESSKRLWLLCWTGLNWFMGHLGRVKCTVNSISTHTSNERIEYTKAIDKLRSYFPNIGIYSVFTTLFFSLLFFDDVRRVPTQTNFLLDGFMIEKV